MSGAGARILMFATKSALKLPLPHGAGGFSTTLQSLFKTAQGQSGNIAKGLTFISTGAQLIDTYQDNSLSAPQKTAAAGAAVCGFAGGFTNNLIYGFVWSQAGGMLTLAKYAMGGAAEMGKGANQLDMANSQLSKFASAPLLKDGKSFVTGQIFSSVLSIALTKSGAEIPGLLKQAGGEMISSSAVAGEAVLTAIGTYGDQVAQKTAHLATLGIVDDGSG